MKIFAPTILLLSSLASAQAPDKLPFDGKWKVHSEIAGSVNDQNCTFIQKDTQLTGKCVTEQGEVQIGGIVEGKKVSWSYNSDYNGTPLTVKYTGTLDSGSISGDTNVDPFGVSGIFTATRSK